MTDQIDQTTSDEIVDIEDAKSGRGRRMFLTGAGIAGAAALVGKAGVAQADDGDNVAVGGDFTGNTPTSFTNDIAGPFDPAAPGSPGAEAIVGDNTDPANPSHTIRGNTNGIGHAIAGTVPAGNADNAVAATWGKHDNGLGAGVGGVNGATDVDIAGPAHGVEGIVIEPTNGSHAVFGLTNGGGHSVAGDTPADTAGPGGVGPNTTAATWGRHAGAGAGIGGINTGTGYGGEFIGGKAHVRLIPVEDSAGAPTDDDHAVGELYADSEGGLFYNTADGNNFERINVTVAAGANVLFDDSQRAFDSRSGEATNTDQGRLTDGETIEIDLKEFTDFEAGFQGAMLNVTLSQPDTSLGGFVTVFNGDTADDDRPSTSSVNWDEQTGEIANAVTVKASARGTIKVYAVRSTDVIVDVIGYFS